MKNRWILSNFDLFKNKINDITSCDKYFFDINPYRNCYTVNFYMDLSELDCFEDAVSFEKLVYNLSINNVYILNRLRTDGMDVHFVYVNDNRASHSKFIMQANTKPLSSNG